jgi:hypothetical protein
MEHSAQEVESSPERRYYPKGRSYAPIGSPFNFLSGCPFLVGVLEHKGMGAVGDFTVPVLRVFDWVVLAILPY